MFVPYARTYTLVSVTLCYHYYKMLFICLLSPKCNQLQEMDFVLYSIAYNRVHKKVKHNITLRCTHAVNAMHAGGHIVGNYQNNERQVNLDGRFFGLEPSPLLYMFCYCICVIYISHS